MLYQQNSLRRFVLPVLKWLSRDIHIRHHFTGDRFRLHSYLHKGYWYHGKNRERLSLDICQQAIRPGDTVIEVGGHIGYLSLFFAQLVGELGQVHVFEPGLNNLPYIEENVRSQHNLTLVRKAAGDHNGTATFYLENLAGQNNSMVKDFDGLQKNLQNAFDNGVRITEAQVEVIRLDDYAAQTGIVPSFVKIDVEGFEFEVLDGLHDTMQHRPVIFVEVQRQHDRVWEFFESHGYRLFADTMQPLSRDEVLAIRTQNVFCFHPEAHASVLSRLMAQRRAA
ncbi:MAG: FkbM family methyltransferase [Planctomycetaceae bacterium]